MSSFPSLTIGIIALRRQLASLWQAHEWSPVQAFVGDIRVGAESGSMIRQDGGAEFYFVGTSNLELHKTETASYRLNIQQNEPRIYVVLKPAEQQEATPSVHLVTVAPDEAESYLEGDEWIVGGVPMPSALRDLVRAFIDEHHVEPPPRKGPRARHRSSAIGAKPGARP